MTRKKQTCEKPTDQREKKGKTHHLTDLSIPCRNVQENNKHKWKPGTGLHNPENRWNTGSKLKKTNWGWATTSNPIRIDRCIEGHTRQQLWWIWLQQNRKVTNLWYISFAIYPLAWYSKFLEASLLNRCSIHDIIYTEHHTSPIPLTKTNWTGGKLMSTSELQLNCKTKS